MRVGDKGRTWTRFKVVCWNRDPGLYLGVWVIATLSNSSAWSSLVNARCESPRGEDKKVGIRLKNGTHRLDSRSIRLSSSNGKFGFYIGLAVCILCYRVHRDENVAPQVLL